MVSNDIVDAFISTKRTLNDAGIIDDFFLDLISSRLLVERIGESDNQGWWESRVLSETGRTRLSEVTPKTQLQSRINLALKVGKKAESDRLTGDSISLFSFGPQLESRLSAAISEIDPHDELRLDELEGLSVESLDEGWTDGIIAETESNITSSGTDPVQDLGSDATYMLDDSGYTQDDIESDKWRILTTLLLGYGYCRGQLRIPYYRLNTDIKPENE